MVFTPPKSSILGGKIPLFFGFNTQILGPWGDEHAGDELVFGRLQVRFVGFFGISESWRFLPSKKPVKQYLNKKLHLDLTNVMKGCWTKNSGILPPKMDGLFHGKPLFFNGWFGGIKSPPICGSTPIWKWQTRSITSNEGSTVWLWCDQALNNDDCEDMPTEIEVLKRYQRGKAAKMAPFRRGFIGRFLLEIWRVIYTPVI